MHVQGFGIGKGRNMAVDADSARESPIITVTEPAQEHIREVMEKKGLAGHALRIILQGRGPRGFQYGMTFAGPEEQTSDDVVVDAGMFNVVIEAGVLERVRGATVDYSDDGFEIENPNPAWDDPRAQTVQELLDSQINPAVAKHGGFVQLMDVQEDTVYLLLGGGCQGCGMVDVTLKQGIEVLIKEALPEIQHVVDTTDHAGGTNPYYEPAKA
jgi:Fe/S biogenesis protein NfuA